MSQFAVTAQIITGGHAGDHHMTIEAINFDEALKAARAEPFVAAAVYVWLLEANGRGPMDEYTKTEISVRLSQPSAGTWSPLTSFFAPLI